MVRELARGVAPTWPDTPTIYGAFLPTVYIPHAAALYLGSKWTESPILYRFYPRWPLMVGYPLARLGSILMGVVTVVAFAAIAAIWTADRRSAFLAGFVATIFPQLVFLNSYVNADSFTVAAGAIFVLAISAWAAAGERSHGLDAVAICAAFVIAGKPSGYFLLVPTAGWLCWAWTRNQIESRFVARALVLFIAIVGPLLVWNTLRNDGDILGLAKFHTWLAQWDRADARTMPNALVLAITTLLESSFARFRNMDLRLPLIFYVAAYLLLFVGLTAATARVCRSREPVFARAAVWLATSVALNLGLVIYDTWFVEFQAQGRWVLLSFLLLTVVAVLAIRTRLWPALYVTFLMLACVASVLVVFRNPCLPQ